MSMPAVLDPFLDLQPASQLEPQPIDWFWPGRLAFGKLAIFDGDPGLGKSLLTLDLCARLSTGRPFPDGSPSPGPANSLILNGEDGAEDTIRPRLAALGADLDRVFVLRRRPGPAREPLRLPAHTDFLARLLARTQARLLVIDPIMAFLDPRVVTGSDQSVRQALFPLAGLAEESRSIISLVRHLNKTLSFRAQYRGGGSIGLGGVCRSNWLVARDPHDSRRRILAEVKNNLSHVSPSLAFTIAAAESAPATISWLGPCPWTADQLLAAAATAPPALSNRDRACDFLKAALANGSLTSREIWALAREQRLARRTLDRAKRDLHIRSVRIWADGKRLSYWLLPGQQLPDSVPPELAPPDLEEWLAPLREQFPPSTPLDDL
jgi:hypothetical protein